MTANHPGPQERQAFLADVLAGLEQAPYSLPSKWLYDRPGSVLFDRICALDAYYPTRTELGILGENAPAIAEAVGPRAQVVELGSGSSNKTRALLDHLSEPVAYLPLDISEQHLHEAAERIAAAYPDLEILPVAADYTREVSLPAPTRPARSTVVYFPGSTLGNFDVADARDFLAQQAALAGPGGGLVIGIDLVKDRDILRRAYDDPEGVTAAFNLNLLERMRRELDAELDPEGFRHKAVFNEELSCVEMHIESLADQEIRIGDRSFPFTPGQTIRTERSYKYTLAGFQRLAEEAGFPQGVVNLVLGPGDPVGVEMSENPGIDLVSFTGGIVTGKKILKAASETVKKVALELGGKNPNIIFGDADFETAVDFALNGVFFHAGQICSAGSRVLVERSIHDRFVAALKERISAIRLGDAFDVVGDEVLATGDDRRGASRLQEPLCAAR